jgi:hypothetical protein
MMAQMLQGTDTPPPATLENGRPLFSWTRPFWTVAFAELWCAWIVLAWGLQLIYVHHAVSMEPVSRALYQMGHIHPVYIGLALLALGFTQLASLFFWIRRLRLLCLLVALAFFLFVTVTFWRCDALLPGKFIVPTYAVATGLRFVQMAGRKE